MLSDFLTLEVYFGGQDSAQALEAAYRRYGRELVENAVRAGDLIVGLTGRFPASAKIEHKCWLSEQGRKKARSEAVAAEFNNFSDIASGATPG